jgi:aldose 1-epimerase
MPASPMTEVSPSGEQHDIGHGRQQAVITEIGATLRSYTIDGMPIIDGFGVTDMCNAGRGQVLAPWPNRLGEGHYSIDGRTGRAAWDEPQRRNAIHGLVRWLPWRLVSRAQNVVVLSCTLFAQPGFPWRLEFVLDYRLGREGLVVTTVVTNADEVPAPFGLGFHPYLTLGSPVIDAVRLTLPGQRCLVTDERGLPTGESIVAGSELDFTSGRRIGPTQLDTAFTGLARDSRGVARVDIDDTETGRGATLWMDERFGYVMAYTADTVEPAGRRRQSLALEPMTCPPDALRSGTDLVRLEPGASWRASWGIAPR